ncbi:cyclophilin-like fold protein [Candidatus Avoscillospira sp. LCP25S3_F1]|uniref:cyclophilin-like fold protein n=1 Tax=Candidatus Avoscillospira sp. LCP25S3_F1 TaxID=3438825 RepID=UPI003F8EECBF
MTKLLCVLLAALGLSACGTAGEAPADPVTPPPQVSVEEPESTGSDTSEASEPSDTAGSAAESEPGAEEPTLKITVGDYELTATFADNPSAEEFRELLAQGPVTVTMEDYGGFEKVGPLGTMLTRSDTQITTEPGDVILYQGNQITIYYGTNSWNFTRLARIDDPTDLLEKLGEGIVQVTFSLS